MRNFLSKTFILLGLLFYLILGYLFWQRTNPQRLSFDFGADQATFAPQATDSAKPVQIIIPELKIDLPIYPARREKNKWEATTKGASYLVSSPLPGEVGNSILYGHNFPNLLGGLTQVKPGEEIQIIFASGVKKTFVVEYTQIVTPNQTQVLAQTDDRRITLYTCTGFLDSKRFVVVAFLKKNNI